MEHLQQLPAPVQTALLIGAIILFAIMAIGISMKALDQLGSRLKLPALILHPLRTVVKGLIMVVALTLIAGQFGIELMSIVTATVAMIAIGFIAVWSIMSNITATLFLVIVKPFSVHDKIEFAGEDIGGEVVDVNLFYTTLTCADGDVVKIPNNHFFQKVLRIKPASTSKAVSLDQQLDRR